MFPSHTGGWEGTGMKRSNAKATAILRAALLTAAGCALATATPPAIEVQRVELRGAGLLDQSLGVVLCVTNPNDAALDFRRVTVGVDVAGTPLAEAASETQVRLPPRSSTLVPFAVATTVRNIGPQLLGVLRTGRVDYRLHGSIQLTGSLAITLPFSRSGRLDLLTVGRDALADAAAPATGTRCSGTIATPAT
jgi:LEA14-like dessication related protein